MLICTIVNIPISIPKWYDWSTAIQVCAADCSEISIPKWYDWSFEENM